MGQIFMDFSEYLNLNFGRRYEKKVVFYNFDQWLKWNFRMNVQLEIQIVS